jgi:hypothetical protein
MEARAPIRMPYLLSLRTIMSASVLWDSPAMTARLTLMNVRRHRVSTVVRANKHRRTATKSTTRMCACVQVAIVMCPWGRATRSWTSARLLRVSTLPLASTTYLHTLVSVPSVTAATTARST